MGQPLPTVLIPGLLCTPRLYAHQIPALWRFGPVTVADHTRDDTMTEIARRILLQAPPRFALVGLSMGGYVSFELLRQAPDRVAKLALLDTTVPPLREVLVLRRVINLLISELFMVLSWLSIQPAGAPRWTCPFQPLPTPLERPSTPPPRPSPASTRRSSASRPRSRSSGVISTQRPIASSCCSPSSIEPKRSSATGS